MHAKSISPVFVRYFVFYACMLHRSVGHCDTQHLPFACRQQSQQDRAPHVLSVCFASTNRRLLSWRHSAPLAPRMLVVVRPPHPASERAHITHRCGHGVEAREPEIGGKRGCHLVVFCITLDCTRCLRSGCQDAARPLPLGGPAAVVEERVVVALSVHLKVVAVVRLPEQPVWRDWVGVDLIGWLKVI